MGKNLFIVPTSLISGNAHQGFGGLSIAIGQGHEVLDA
jgi:hypothetical protein